MKAANDSRTSSLWREGLDAFQRHGRAWLKPALGFFCLLAAAWIMMLNEVQGPLQALPKELPKDPHERLQLLMPIMKPFVLWFSVIEIVLFVQHFAFTVFFSRRELGVGEPKLSVGRLLYALAKVAQVMLACILIAIVFGVVLFGIEQIPGLGKNFAKILSLLTAGAGMAVIYYIMIRYSLVMVLAVNKIRPVLRTSWSITADNWWRLFGNFIVIVLCLVMFSIGVALISGATAWALRALLHMPTEGQMSIVSMGLKSALEQTLFLGVFAAYFTSTTRILLDEKK